MREIKFRAWDKGKKYWMDWEPSTRDNGFFWEQVVVFSQFYELFQFTGLKDKHGKEIFEGDIVREVFDEPRKRRPGILEVEIPSIYYERWVQTAGEIIGNIHENPELLHKG